ncbi:MAG: hypothetical protein Tsb0021_01730 [Chlamydiales bacterium]
MTTLSGNINEDVESFSTISLEESSTGSSLDQKIKEFIQTCKNWSLFTKECIIKEFGSCLKHGLIYPIMLKLNPHIYGLNPLEKDIPAASESDKIAKIILLANSLGSSEASALPIAKELSRRGITHIFTVKLNQTDENPVPLSDMVSRINEIVKMFQERGYEQVKIEVIGPSLGGITGTDCALQQKEVLPDNVEIQRVISIAARLKNVVNEDFAFFTGEDVLKEVARIYNKLCHGFNFSLYTIWGDQDKIVPKEAAHVQNNVDLETTVAGWGHVGIVFAPETVQTVANLTEDWLNESSTSFVT